MPVLEVRLDPGDSVIAESGQLGWCSDSIELETSTALGGSDGLVDATKRSFGGSSFFMTSYSATTAPGTVSFPAKLPGTIFEVPLGPGREYVIQRHGFLAGTPGCELTTAFSAKQFGAGFLGGFGFLLQRLEGVGRAWVELAGELTEYDLAAGQSLRVHPAHIGLVESGVEVELTTVPGVTNKLFGGDGLFLVRLTGPGKVWLQSLSVPVLAHALQPYLATGGAQTPAQGAETLGVAAAIGTIGKLLA